MIKRRRLLTLLSGSILLNKVYAFADDPYIGNSTSIQKNNTLTNKTGLYAKMASMGAYGYPENVYYNQPMPDLKIKTFLPPNIKEARIIIFSHAEKSAPEEYSELLKHWASHGFIVVAPIHQDSYLIQNEYSDMNIKDLVQNENLWKSRKKDCSQCLDLIPIIEHTFGIKILNDRPIIAGHLLGSFITSLIIGSTSVNDKNQEKIILNDNRFYAGLLLSPYGHGYLGQNEDSWNSVDRPLMVVTGEKDFDTFQEKVQNKIDPYYLSPSGNKHLIWFCKIWNSLYGGNNLSENSPYIYLFQDLLATTTTFLDAYSKYEEDKLKELSTNYFQNETQNRISIAYR